MVPTKKISEGKKMRKLIPIVMAVLLLSLGIAAQALTWETAVDHASTLTNQMRSLALAQQTGNDSVYFGYIQKTGGYRDVVRVSTVDPYTQLNTRGGSNDQPKSIATDDRGYVYVGNRLSGGNSGSLFVHNATLGAAFSSVSVPDYFFGGIATYRSGSDYFVYASSETSGRINRYNVNDPTNMILDTSFGVNGTYTLAGGSGILRGLTVANDGSIFVTSRDDSKLYKISADLAAVSSADVTGAMDVALYGGNAYVTSYNGADSKIAVFSTSSIGFVEDITISTLDANAYTRGTAAGWGGIDIGADGRIWITDQAYGSTSVIQDRLLVSSALPGAPQAVPEPATLLGFGLPVLMIGLGKLKSLRK